MQKIIIGREYPEVITKLVKEAKQSIKILIYDWRWYPAECGATIQKFNNEILFASRRGVSVFALVNSNFICNVFADTKIKIKKINSKKTMHIKMIIIDDKYLLIGSHNLTKNAFAINHEISVLLDDEISVKRCNDFFANICLL